jgi:exonuclease SbcD
VTSVLPNALEVRIDPEFAAAPTESRPKAAGAAPSSPAELFREYLGTRGVDDPRVEPLFQRLHERVLGGG